MKSKVLLEKMTIRLLTNIDGVPHQYETQFIIIVVAVIVNTETFFLEINR